MAEKYLVNFVRNPRFVNGCEFVLLTSCGIAGRQARNNRAVENAKTHLHYCCSPVIVCLAFPLQYDDCCSSLFLNGDRFQPKSLLTNALTILALSPSSQRLVSVARCRLAKAHMVLPYYTVPSPIDSAEEH